jgi:hypothetical protein
MCCAGINTSVVPREEWDNLLVSSRPADPNTVYIERWRGIVKLAVGLWVAVPILMLPGLVWIAFEAASRTAKTAPGDGIPIAFSVFASGSAAILAIACSLYCLTDFVRIRRATNLVGDADGTRDS